MNRLYIQTIESCEGCPGRVFVDHNLTYCGLLKETLFPTQDIDRLRKDEKASISIGGFDPINITQKITQKGNVIDPKCPLPNTIEKENQSI